MYNYLYPRPAVTCDIIITTKSQPKHLLLIKRKQNPFKDCWALPGGFVDMNETLHESAVRELQEETGLTISELSQFRTYGAVDRDPRGRTISVVFTALVDSLLTTKAGDDAAEAKWFEMTNLPPLAFDHAKIMDDFILSQINSSASDS